MNKRKTLPILSAITIIGALFSSYVAAQESGCNLFRFNFGKSYNINLTLSCETNLITNESGSLSPPSEETDDDEFQPDLDELTEETASLWLEYFDNYCYNYDGFSYSTFEDIQDFEGDWYCEGNGAENLPPAGPTYFSGNLNFWDVPISSTSSFNNTYSMGAFFSNANMVNLDGFSNLVYAGNLGFSELPLNDISGLSHLRSVVALDLVELYNVTSISPLSSLREAESISIYGTGISSLNGLEGLNTIYRGIYVDGNPNLRSLDGLQNLTSAAGVFISENPNLRDVSGLSNLANANVVVLNVESISQGMSRSSPFCQSLSDYFNNSQNEVGEENMGECGDCGGPEPQPEDERPIVQEGFGEVAGFEYDDVCTGGPVVDGENLGEGPQYGHWIWAGSEAVSTAGYNNIPQNYVVGSCTINDVRWQANPSERLHDVNEGNACTSNSPHPDGEATSGDPLQCYVVDRYECINEDLHVGTWTLTESYNSWENGSYSMKNDTEASMLEQYPSGRAVNLLDDKPCDNLSSQAYFVDYDDGVNNGIFGTFYGKKVYTCM